MTIEGVVYVVDCCFAKARAPPHARPRTLLRTTARPPQTQHPSSLLEPSLPPRTHSRTPRVFYPQGKFYDPHTAVEALVVVPAGKAACTQRAGRAGRVRPGRCFRLCTEEGYLGLPDAAPPEMQRSELTGTVLQLKALGIDNLLDFEVRSTSVRTLAFDPSVRVSREEENSPH